MTKSVSSICEESATLSAATTLSRYNIVERGREHSIDEEGKHSAAELYNP